MVSGKGSSEREGAVFISKAGLLCCEKCHVEMESRYAKYVCPECGLTVGDVIYERLLKRFMDMHGIPELRYPV